MARHNAKDKILNRATQLASVVGLNGVTIGQLATEVGMSKGGICAHFPRKSDLQVATVERAAEIFRREVIEPARKQAPGLPRIRALNEAWFRYLEAHVFEGGCFFVRTMLELAEQDVPARAVVQQGIVGLIEFIKLCAEEAIQMGHFSKQTEPEQFALEMHGIHVAALLWKAIAVAPKPFATARAAAQRLLQLNEVTP